MTTFAEHVDDYLRLRRALGFKLEEHARLLPRFAAHLDAIGAEVVTIELALAMGAGAGRAGWQCRAGDAAAGRPRVRALSRRDRPADRGPADRADPAAPAPPAAVHLHRRAGRSR